jgi:beta-phosphoglucomutase-like phosphatase (HAD superfamily)
MPNTATLQDVEKFIQKLKKQGYCIGSMVVPYSRHRAIKESLEKQGILVTTEDVHGGVRLHLNCKGE